MAWNNKIPVDTNGNILWFAWSDKRIERYRQNYINRNLHDRWLALRANWIDAFEFTGYIRFVESRKINHGVYLVFKDKDNREYPMFLCDLLDIINKINNGEIWGTWKFIKRGPHFGIVLK